MHFSAFPFQVLKKSTADSQIFFLGYNKSVNLRLIFIIITVETFSLLNQNYGLSVHGVLFLHFNANKPCLYTAVLEQSGGLKTYK